MSFVKLGARVGRIAWDVPSTRRSMSNIDNYTKPNRITLYDVSNLVTPGDIRRAIKGKLEGVTKVQIDYRGFRPSGKAMITINEPEHLAKGLRALRPLTICGLPVRPVPHYSPELSQLPRMRGAKGFQEAIERGLIRGNGPEGNFPNVEKNVVLWGLPGKVSVDEVTRALVDFKTAKKNGKPIIVKLEKQEAKFTVFSRFIVTMSTISEARRLVRAWHMTPWKIDSPDSIRAQILY